MPTEMEILRAEVAALRGEVRRKRRYGRLFPVALVALFFALIPGLAIAANPFNDLVPNSVHNANIDAIYNAGITTGCTPNVSYCPTDLVTRQEMASFLARTAGLGANPPVANAKTAQTAVNATHATSADTATTATSATNANTLNGFAANGLVRTNVSTTGTTSLGVNSSVQGLTAITLTLPAPGLIIVTGGVTFTTPPSGTQFSEVAAFLGDRTSAAQSTPLLAFVGNVTGAVGETSLSPSWVFQATAGGQRTFDLLVTRNPQSVGTATAFSGTLTATYVPFGPGGVQAAEVSEGAPIVWHLPAQP